MEFYLRHVYPYLKEVASLSSLILLVVGIFVFRKIKGRQAWFLWSYLLLIFATETAARITISLGTKNNIWIDHLYNPLEYVFLALIFYQSIHVKAIKVGIGLSIVVVVVVSLLDALSMGSIEIMNAISRSISSALLVSIAIAYFYQTVNELKIVYLDKDPLFLLSCGVLIYKAGTSMSYALFNHALAISYDAARMCISVLLVLNILYYISLAFILRRMAA